MSVGSVRGMAPPNRHEPLRAWLIGGAYFVACWLVAGLAGVLDESLAGDVGGIGFWLLTLGALPVAYVAYWVVWPLGTYTADRSARPVAASLFGVVHGLSEGILYVAIWLVIDREFEAGSLVVVLSLAAIAVYNGLWRTFVWDVWVTPPHNIEAWNLRKIAFVHVPVLALGLSHLTLYRSVAVFLAIEVIALVGAAVHMRFPAPR